MSIEFYIEKLKQYPREQKVKRGFGDLTSWRGSYDEAAVGVVEDTTVGEMLDHAVEALGTQMEGYKGGQYPIELRTTLNVEEWGCYTDGEYAFGLLLDLMLDDTTAKMQAENERLSIQSNKFELIAEDHEAAMNCLDDMGAPRYENDIELSHHGRVLRLLEPKDAEIERLRSLFREAADYLDKGYGTSIGGGSIFHQQFREASDA